MKRLLYIGAIFFALGWPTANAAEFRLEFQQNGFVLYSTFEKPEQCSVNVYFTFMHEGERKEGETLCGTKPIPSGKDQKFCAVSHRLMIEIQGGKPMKVDCTPLPADPSP